MAITIHILKLSNQNEDGSYDYVKMAGAFFKFEDAMAEAVPKRERMKLEWPNYKQGMHNSCTLWIQSETVCSILEHTAEYGKTYKVQFYNLDDIIPACISEVNRV